MVADVPECQKVVRLMWVFGSFTINIVMKKSCDQSCIGIVSYGFFISLLRKAFHKVFVDQEVDSVMEF